jgi:hypothetical protein
MRGLVARMMRAAQLDAALYEEVEADHRALWQATTVVVLSSLAAGVSSRGSGVPGGVVATTLAALLGWYIWAYLTYLVGTRWLPEPHTEADWGQLLCTIGFASAPGVLRVGGSVFPGPGWTGVVFSVVAAWRLVAMVIAARQALDYESPTRAGGGCRRVGDRPWSQQCLCGASWGSSSLYAGHSVIAPSCSCPRVSRVWVIGSLLFVRKLRG